MHDSNLFFMYFVVLFFTLLGSKDNLQAEDTVGLVTCWSTAENLPSINTNPSQPAALSCYETCLCMTSGSKCATLTFKP